MIKIRFKSMLIVAVMAFQTTVNAATVSIEDATQRMVRISELSGAAKIIATDFIGGDDIDLEKENVQTFDSLSNDEKSVVLSKRTKYIRQLITDADHVFSLPAYGVYTIFVKEGVDAPIGYEIAMNDPAFVSNHMNAQNIEALEKNLTDSQPYMRGELAEYFALENGKTAVATRLFARRAEDTTKEKIVERVILFSILQNIINADATDKTTLFEQADAVIGHSSFTEKAVYDSKDSTFQQGVVSRFVSFADMDGRDEFDNCFSQAIFLEKVKTAVLAQAIPQLVEQAKEKFGVSVPRYDALGTKTTAADQAVLGQDYKTVAEFISALEASAKQIKNQQSGSGSGGTVYRENKGNDINLMVENPSQMSQISQESPKTLYHDVEETRWSHEPIYILTKRGIIAGDGNGEFRPADGITREEFVKVVISAFGLTDHTAICEFGDVLENSWSYPYIATAKQYGLVSGKEGNTFCPKDKITRQEAALIMYNVAKFKNIPVKMQREAPGFADLDVIDDWAKEAVVYLYRCNIIDGMSTAEFAPQNNITREQTAQLVYNLLKVIV